MILWSLLWRGSPIRSVHPLKGAQRHQRPLWCYTAWWCAVRSHISACACRVTTATGKYRRASFRGIVSTGIIRATNSKEREEPCFYVSEESVSLQSSTVKGWLTAASEHKPGRYFRYELHVVTVGKWDSTSTQNAETGPANRKKLVCSCLPCANAISNCDCIVTEDRVLEAYGYPSC